MQDKGTQLTRFSHFLEYKIEPKCKNNTLHIEFYIFRMDSPHKVRFYQGFLFSLVLLWAPPKIFSRHLQRHFLLELWQSPVVVFLKFSSLFHAKRLNIDGKNDLYSNILTDQTYKSLDLWLCFPRHQLFIAWNWNHVRSSILLFFWNLHALAKKIKKMKTPEHWRPSGVVPSQGSQVKPSQWVKHVFNTC